MTQSKLDTTSLYDALTLSERASLFRAISEIAAADSAKFDAELASRRLIRWRSQTPFVDDTCFNQRLTVDQLSEATFGWLLGLRAEELSTRLSDLPPWLQELHNTYQEWTSRTRDFESGNELGFITWLRPLIQSGSDRLEARFRSIVEAHPAAPFLPEQALNLFLPALYNQLTFIALRTMILELNVARIEGRLKGETANGRFLDFVGQLGRPETASSLLQQYPVLARMSLQCIDRWVSSSSEFLSRLSQDWVTVRKELSPADEPGFLTQVLGGVGDTHRGGRSVFIASFASGFKLVYKPHSLAVDSHFADLQQWLNDSCNRPPLRIIKVVDRGQYGWAEFVQSKCCQSEDEVSRFYQRLGSSLALLYVLDATDFHHENIIASGEAPALIDLESLFQPRLRVSMPPALRLSRDIMLRSVLRIGLLPQQSWQNSEGEGMDISGIGGRGGQVTPFSVAVAEKPGTDEMRLVRRPVEIGPKNNRPTLNGNLLNPANYVEEICSGFSETYWLLVMHRTELLAEDGPLSRFAADEVRFLARPTKTYARLLDTSYHPHVLRSALDRDRLLDKLWVGIDQRPEMARLIPAEHADLQQGDIPAFTTRPASRHLCTSSGTVITDVLEDESFSAVCRNVKDLSEDDLSRQLWFIRASLATTEPLRHQGRSSPSLAAGYETPADSCALVAAACRIGDRLESISFNDGKHVGWAGLSPIFDKSWSVLPIGSDLYDGLAGLALFFAYLGTVAQDERYTAIARMSIDTAIKQYDESIALADIPKRVGAFTGDSSLIYTINQLVQLWNEPELFEYAARLIETLNRFIDQDNSLDIMEGTAGYLCVLDSVYRSNRLGAALDGVVRCAEHLLLRADEIPDRGVGWPNPARATGPLTGFSHGTSGIAHALLRAAMLTGDERYSETALRAFEYERSQFVPAQQNWRDLRIFKERPENSGEDNFMVGWCHGAPGIGLSRLSIPSLLSDSNVKEEIQIALDTTARFGFTGVHSICHGDLGNIELLLQASLTEGYGEWKRIVFSLASRILETGESCGWVCATPSGAETPGLMIGLAGIGYSLLRLARPDFVPSVLTLQPPLL